MNTKMCKKLRKALLKAGYVKVEMKLRFVYEKDDLEISRPTMPKTFKYPQDSFQRAYRNVKKQHRFGR